MTIHAAAGATNAGHTKPALRIGWAQTDITPEEPTLLVGLFHARLSEGVSDPLTATVWALESNGEQAVFVGCDLIHISDELREAVRSRLRESAAAPDPVYVILHATHTHTAPPIGKGSPVSAHAAGGGSGAELAAIPVEAYVDFVAGRIAGAIVQAWASRAPGGVAFGQGTAVIGRNRRWVDADGLATMYSRDAQNKQRLAARTPNEEHDDYFRVGAAEAEQFRHIEGCEDHHVQLIAVYDAQVRLTGLVVNVPCPSQESEDAFTISADWWHETRGELRRRFGGELFVLPQCGAAGDLSPHVLLEADAHARMLALRGRTSREEIAWRIADAVGDVLPYLFRAIDWSPALLHRVGTVELTASPLTADDAREAEAEAERWRAVYREELRKAEERPELRETPRWYVDLTYAYGRMRAQRGIADRYAAQRVKPTLPVEVHAVRLGELAFATQPFECYLDLGLQMRVNSPAVQTFLVQLAGGGTYLPSARSVQGGGYGSTAASNPVGPEGGRQLVRHTVSTLRSLWGGVDAE